MRILVLEKKPMVSLIPKMLSHHNYEADVEYTSDLSEAMRWYSTRAPYDVVLAGLFGANGLPLAEHIRQNNPSQVVGIMTGFEGEELPAQIHELNIPVLRKPFSSDALIDFIESIKPHLS